jgi:hypothetical protein
MTKASPDIPCLKRIGKRRWPVVVRVPQWRLWFYYDSNNPPYLCKYAVHVGPLMITI